MAITFNKEQLEILSRLGLSKIQATLYLTSLKHGVLSVLELSKLTKINRQQIYSEAEELVEFGIYDLTRKQGRKYIPANPGKLIKIGKKKINETEKVLTELSAILPNLEVLSTQKKNKVIVKYFEGIPKIKEAYEEELETSKNTEVLSLAGSIDDIFEFLPESYWDKWNRKFVKYDSRSRMLVHNSEAARRTIENDKQYKRETRWIEKFPLKVNIDVFNNTVLIVSFHDEMAIWIESHMLAQSYRIMFNTLWELSKPFK
ncbi:MAG: helix-turn-helix domain-containing protein [Candidatus Buchananbacteria bacterium]